MPEIPPIGCYYGVVDDGVGVRGRKRKFAVVVVETNMLALPPYDEIDDGVSSSYNCSNDITISESRLKREIGVCVTTPGWIPEPLN